MDAITVLSETSDVGSNHLAISGDDYAVGETVGSAVDGLVAKFGGLTGTTLVVLRSMEADEFFGESQRRRLGELMPRLRSSTEPLSADELDELHRLVQEELDGAARRSAALLEHRGRSEFRPRTHE